MPLITHKTGFKTRSSLTPKLLFFSAVPPCCPMADRVHNPRSKNAVSSTRSATTSALLITVSPVLCLTHNRNLIYICWLMLSPEETLTLAPLHSSVEFITPYWPVARPSHCCQYFLLRSTLLSNFLPVSTGILKQSNSKKLFKIWNFMIQMGFCYSLFLFCCSFLWPCNRFLLQISIFLLPCGQWF